MLPLKKRNSFERRRYYSARKVPSPLKFIPIKRMDAQEYEKTIQELLEKIEMLESRIVETGLDKIKIVTSHQKLTAENDYLRNEVKSAEKENNLLKNKNLSSSVPSFKSSLSSFDNFWIKILRASSL